MLRIESMLAEEGRGLEEVTRRRSRAGIEIEIVAGPCDDENVAGVFTENVKVPLPLLLLLVVVKVRFFAV